MKLLSNFPFRITQLIIAINLFFNVVEAQPTFSWAKQMESNAPSVGFAITKDFSGNIYTTGTFNGTTDFDPSANVYNLTSSAIYGQNVFETHTAYISKLDANGNFVWAKKLEGVGSVEVNEIKTYNNNIYVCGTFQDTVDFDPSTSVYNVVSNGFYDSFISKYDLNGNMIWTKTWGGLGYDISTDFDIDLNGNLLITGSFADDYLTLGYSTVDFDPGVGVNSISTSDYGNLFILKLDGLGNFIWVKSTFSNGNAIISGASIDICSNNDVIIGGSFQGTIDVDFGTNIFNITSPPGSSGNWASNAIFILKLDNNGNFIWTKVITDLEQISLKITLDSFNNIIVGITTIDGTLIDFDPNAAIYNLPVYSSGGYDSFILKLDINGNFIWVKREADAPCNDVLSNITADACGNIYSVGTVNCLADFDPSSNSFYLASSGTSYDSKRFISKLDANGNFIWAGESGSGNIRDIYVDSFFDIFYTGGLTSPLGLPSDFDTGSGVFNLNLFSASNPVEIFVSKLNGTICCISPQATITPLSNLNFCNGNSTILDAGSGFSSYLWLPSGQTTQTISINTTGNYSVIVSNACGVDTSAAVSASLLSSPTVSIIGLDHLCNGSSLTLTGVGAATYTWNTSSTNTVISVSPTTNTTYTLIGSNGTCTNIAIQTITVNSLPIANAGLNQTICEGETINLIASGGTTYLWSTGETTSNISVNPISTSIYTLTAFNGSCSNSTVVAVSVNSTPTISINPSSVLVCNGSSITLTGVGAATYTWNTSSTNTIITVSPITNTTYTLIGSNGTCTNIAIQTITVNSLPIANAGLNQTICEGETINLIASGGTTYLWSTGETTSNISVNPISTSIYTLTAFNGSCSNNTVVTVTVNSAPIFTISSDATIIQGSSIALNASGGLTYNWTPNNNLICSTCSSISVTPLFNTQYCVEVKAANGCTNFKCVNVTVDIKCGELFIPNGFSPNADGKNDFFDVFINKACVKDFSLLIFDRWGEKIFESTDINISWDGTNKGFALDNAVFVYYLKASLYGTDTPLLIKGNVSLIK